MSADDDSRYSAMIRTHELVEGISVWNRRRVDTAFGALLAWLVDRPHDHGPGPVFNRGTRAEPARDVVAVDRLTRSRKY